MELESKPNIGDDKKYKVKVMKNSVIYINKVIRGQLLRLYDLISWKSYLEILKNLS